MLDHLLGGIQDVIQHRGRYYWKARLFLKLISFLTMLTILLEPTNLSLVLAVLEMKPNFYISEDGSNIRFFHLFISKTRNPALFYVFVCLRIRNVVLKKNFTFLFAESFRLC